MATFTVFTENSSEVATMVGGKVNGTSWYCKICNHNLILVQAENSEKNKRIVRKLYREGKIRSYAKF